MFFILILYLQSPSYISYWKWCFWLLSSFSTEWVSSIILCFYQRIPRWVISLGRCIDERDFLCVYVKERIFLTKLANFFQVIFWGVAPWYVYVDKKSTKVALKRGQAQQSILGPLLFVIYTCDLGLCIHGCGCHRYADDIQVCISYTDNQMARVQDRLDEPRWHC